MSRLRLAIPSKGRLKEQAEEWFADCGLPLEPLGGARGYAARIPALDGVEVLLMSAGEIAGGVISGELHLGVTGEDLLREAAPKLDAVVHLAMPLGFGRARLVVAVPKGWIDVDEVADLDDLGARREARTGEGLRIATKYTNLARRFLTAQGVGHYRIVPSAGATEGAPASGAADLIVDITSSGQTLESNGLKVLRDGVILDSQAQLALSLRAEWSETELASLRALMDAADARKRGRTMRVLSFSPVAGAGVIPPDVDRLEPGVILCRASHAHDVARTLAAAGAGPVRISLAEFIFSAENPAFDAAKAALGDRRRST